MNVEVKCENSLFFRALGSETRLKIIEILSEESKNIGEIAGKLNISSAIITRHIAMLEEAGIIECTNTRGKRGLQKNCFVKKQNILLSFNNEKNEEIENKFMKTESISIGVGQFVNYEIEPSCGLSSSESYIGVFDDPRYFSSPDRQKASLVWFKHGFLEYLIPSYLFSARPIETLEISLEICSEFPGYNEDCPSDIYFYLNDILLGMWTCPGDFGDKKGAYTPIWWGGGTEYGLLKKIVIGKNGTMIDGIKLSDVTIQNVLKSLSKDLVFKIESPKETNNPGGINIFGNGFGNYDQGIEVSVKWNSI